MSAKKQETASSIFDDFYSGFSGEQAPAKDNAAKKANLAKADDAKSKIFKYIKWIF